MKFSKSISALLGVLVLASCVGHLPRSVRDEVGLENERLQEAERQLQRAQDQVHADLAKAPDLFRDSSQPAEWNAALKDAHDQLSNAEGAGKEATELARRDRRDSLGQLRRALAEEREQRLAALQRADAVEAAADKWLDVQRDPSFYLDKLNREHAAIRDVDLSGVSKTVHKAGDDWPEKKADLDAHLAALVEIPKSAETQWAASETARHDAAAGKLTGTEVATLIGEDDELSSLTKTLPHKASDLENLSGQLYNAWDKILIDLDVGHDDGRDDYKEEIRTVRTHYLDVPSKKTETSSDVQWVDVSEPAFHSVENDIGMAIAHKDAGLYDSEAQTTPEPAGFAYIASPSQGSNQYGYWTQQGGQSVWTFLPEYLLLRELMWGHNYQPIVVDEYRGYRTARDLGHTYYGQPTPTSPPKYGTHGTFTQTHYAQSRYIQSGGFKNSTYASHRSNGSSSPFAPARPGGQEGESLSRGTAGRRFGSPPGSHGKRFGGFHAPGHRFGRR